MSYYMRFISTDDTETTPSVLEQALKEMDSRYSIAESGELSHGDDVYGLVEINRLGESLFEKEIGELKEYAEDVRGKRRADVLNTLENARAIIAVPLARRPPT